MNTGPSGYDIAALIIAGIAGAMALASLVWNIAEFRLSGPRVKVELCFGAVGPAGLVSAPAPPRDPQFIIRQGFTDPLVGINVVNRGRVSTEVHHFRCKLSNGFALADVQAGFNPPLPFVLDPHRAQTWWLPAMEVNALVHASGRVGDSARRAHMEIDITGPKTHRTKSFALVATDP